MVVQSELGKGSAMPTDPHHIPTILQSSSSQPQKTHKPRKPTRKVTQEPQPSDPIEHVADEAVHKELGDSLVRAATTASSLEAERNSEVVSTAATITTEELTLAQALEALKTSKPKVKGIVIQEQEDPCRSKTTTTTISKQQSQDKGGGGFVGGSGSGGDGWKRGEAGLIMVAGKTGWDDQW
nr:hypothetical protein [Tanacetum cinerariifolium]